MMDNDYLRRHLEAVGTLLIAPAMGAVLCWIIELVCD